LTQSVAEKLKNGVGLREPVRVVSDLHLGHRATRVEEVGQLVPLLDGVGTLVCAGDTWEEIAGEFAGRGAAMLEELRGLAAERGVRLVLLPGNHDPGAPGPGFVELAGGAVFVTHGHMLFRDGAPWSRMLPERRTEVERVWREAGGEAESLDGRLRVANDVARVLVAPDDLKGRSAISRIWDAAVPPARAWRMLQAWRRFPGEAARMAACFRPEARVVVVGHFHRAGVWRRGGRRVVNTGSFMPPGAAWCVDVEAGRVAVRKIRRGAVGCFEPGRVRTIHSEGSE